MEVAPQSKRFLSRRNLQAGSSTVANVVTVVVVVLLLLWLVVPIPPMDWGTVAGTHQSAAIYNLRKVFMALSTYFEVCGGYPATLAGIAPLKDGEKRDCTHLGNFAAEFTAPGESESFDPVLAGQYEQMLNPEKSGYRMVYEPVEEMPEAKQGIKLYRRYRIFADPVDRGTTGYLSIYCDPTMVLRLNQTQRAGPGDPAIQDFRGWSRTRLWFRYDLFRWMFG